MDFRLTSEQQLVQDSMKRFVSETIEPILNAHDKEAPLSKDVVKQIVALCAEQGLTSGRLPEDAGGLGVSALTFGIMKEQLPPVISSMCGVQEATALRIHLTGTPEQSERFVPKLVSGELLGCSATTEPDVGSDPRGVKLRGVIDGDEIVLNGQKMWIGGVTIADLALVATSMGKDSRGYNDICWVVVERAHSPFATQLTKTLGHRQGHIGEAFFDDCRVPVSNIIAKDTKAPAILQRTWLAQRPMLGLLAVNMAQKALDASIVYSQERRMFGKAIGSFQLVQELIADIATAVTTSRLLCYNALNAIDNGTPSAQLSAMAKRYSISACTRAVSLAMEVHGAMGISSELGLEELYRDIRMLPIADGTNQILTLIEGRELTGLSAIR